jgi:hypothetical protein
LINTLPNKLTQAFRVVILADTAFGSVAFLQGVRKRRYAAIVGVRLLLLEVERTRPLLKAFGLSLQLSEVIT